MKRLFLAVACLATLSVSAAPGDTTTVQAHSTVQFNHYGNFDTTIEFPDGAKTYRKVLMTFTLGKYQCPGSPQYCGDWDYTVTNFLMTPNGDTVEIGKFITPYANANYPRTPWAWKQRYVFDVTDFYPLLKDSATVRVNYSGYSWGFTGDIKFEFIEGTPPRNVIGVDRIWGGSSRYGDTSQATSIEDRVAEQSLTAPAQTQFSELRFTVSGHGNDDNGCSEFCKKYYEVELNGTKFDKTDMWRADCGYNHMYPQSGTWIYDRGNWCPGDVVFPNWHKLAGVTSGNNYTLDVDFENYIGTKNISGRSWGSFSYQGTVFYYGGFNKSVDASLDDIIAPSNHETHFRQNPFTGRPIVKVQNTGSTTVTTIKFKYSIDGGSGDQEYTWNGSLAALETAEIEFAPFYDLRTASGTNKFNVEIVEVNGSADEDATNNKMSSQFEAAPQFPMNFFITLKTNNAGNETSWKITDMFNNIVMAERNGTASNTTYVDTVKLGPAMYKLEVTDQGCDGLQWWANPNAGVGTFAVNRFGSIVPIPLNGYFTGDFGCGFTQYFNVDWPAGVSEAAQMNVQMVAYPNPATDKVIVSLKGIDKVSGNLQVIDMTGRTVMTSKAVTNTVELNTQRFANGMYTIIFHDNDAAKLQTRVLIAK